MRSGRVPRPWMRTKQGDLQPVSVTNKTFQTSFKGLQAPLKPRLDIDRAQLPTR
jgi:hypothetical protein